MITSLLPQYESDLMVKRVDAHLKESHERQMADIQKRLEQIDREREEKENKEQKNTHHM